MMSNISATIPTPIARLEAARALAAQDLAKAQGKLEALIKDNPEFLPARRLLARILRDRNKYADAAHVELEGIALGNKRPSFVTAEKAFLEGDIDRAEPLIRAHLKLDPEDPAAALMLGEIAARCGANREAVNLYKRAILFAPAYIEPRLAIAKFFRDLGQYEDALAALNELLLAKHDHLSALSLKAAIYEQLRNFDDADSAFHELHKHHPNDARGWANHAFLLKTIGRQNDSVSAYRRAIEIDGGYALAWWGLSNLKIVQFTKEDAKAIEAALKGGNSDTDERVNLFYALGKARDDLGNHAGAFAAYQEGARLRLENVPYDPQKVQDHITKSRTICTPKFFEKREGLGSLVKDPIFIVSLPRSGSTLIEQILASHPLIEGTEELHDLERIALSLDPKETGAWLNVLPGLDAAKLRELGEHYVAATRRYRQTERPYFTDKMPSNWIFLGLIRSILPNAKIVDIRRHPMGCGFANFSQHFNWGIDFSYNLNHIAGFYSAYMRQMAHFDRVLPGWIHHVNYEDLVEDTESEVRRLLNYLDLPFDEACVRFHENRRAVFTPSSEQVRSPINRHGMERWKKYAEFLEPLEIALGPILEFYPATPPLEDI